MASLWDFLATIPDVAKSFGTGLVDSGTDLIGIPGAVRQMVQNKSNQLFDQVDAATGYHPPQRVEPAYNILPTSQQMDQSLNFMRHRPETEAGTAAYVAGGFLPPVLSGLGMYAARKGAVSVGDAMRLLMMDPTMQRAAVTLPVPAARFIGGDEKLKYLLAPTLNPALERANAIPANETKTPSWVDYFSSVQPAY